MKLNPLESIHGTIIAGIILAVVLAYVVKMMVGA